MRSNHASRAIFVASALLALAAAAPAQTPIPANWCTHSTAQRLSGDVNGDSQPDALCHERSSGTKWIALHESVGLVERWVNTTVGWCRHSGSRLYLSDANGDRHADLICKNSTRIWVDYASSDFYLGTEFYLDTNWCTHAGATFFIGDQDNDGRGDLVCRGTDGFYWLDYADSGGRFGGSDVARFSPDSAASGRENWRTPAR